MRLLLLATTFLMATTGWARTNAPEMVDWVEYQTMTEPHKAEYLRAVAGALSEFEQAAAEVFEADRFASYPYFKELFAVALDEAMPRAHAALPDEVNCADVEFSVPKGSNNARMCMKVGKMTQCTPLGESSYADIATVARKCPGQYRRSALVVASFENFGGKHPELAAKTPGPFGPNSMVAQSTAGEKPAATAQAGLEAKTGFASKVEPKALGCSKASDLERPKIRAKYRETPHPACLVAGVISEYPTLLKGGSKHGRCKLVTTDANKKLICTKDNSFNKSGVLGVPPSRRTSCVPELYCTKSGGPICTEGNDTALKNCDEALKKNSNLQFGPECIKYDSKKYQALRDKVESVCSNELARSLLCDDCTALTAKLDKFQALLSSGKPADNPAAPAGGGTRGTKEP